MDLYRHGRTSFLKWRTYTSLITFGVAWVIIGDAKLAVAIGLVDAAAKAGIFYLRERFCEHSRLKVTDDPI